MDPRSWELARRHVTYLCSQPLLEKLALTTRGYRKSGIRDMIKILNNTKELLILEGPESGTTFISVDFLESFALLDSSGTPILSPKLHTLFAYSKDINFELFAQALVVRSLCSPGKHAVLITVTILCDEHRSWRIFGCPLGGTNCRIWASRCRPSTRRRMRSGGDLWDSRRR